MLSIILLLHINSVVTDEPVRFRSGQGHLLLDFQHDIFRK